MQFPESLENTPFNQLPAAKKEDSKTVHPNKYLALLILTF